ncbi:MAG: hypothetical protein M1484_00900 [Patescibacteria group bacterium]|nr:hypothetical protein [Patescibacteria group bacterium]
MEKLGLPTSFPVSEFQNVGFLLAYYDIYKKMEIDPGQKKQVLGVILQTAASKILDTTEELRRAKIVRTKEHYISEDRRMEIFEPWLKDNNYLYALSELRERFPELAGDTDKDVIVKTREELERAILERAKNDEVKAEMLGKLDDDVGGYSVGEDLTPHAILFYDDWVDSRFINGVIPAGFAKGTIRVAGGGADKDAPALIELYRDGKAKLKPLTSQLRTFLYIPPNMTNAYLVRVPAITPEIAQLESRGGLVLSEDSNCRSQDRLSLIFCERTDALHPTKMPERLDRSFGKDKYVLLKNGDQKLSDTPRSKLRGICIAKIA